MKTYIKSLLLKCTIEAIVAMCSFSLVSCSGAVSAELPPPILDDESGQGNESGQGEGGEQGGSSGQDGSQGDENDGDGSITLVTYNVGGFYKSGSNSTELVANMMKELDPMAISMNELDSCTTRHPEYQLGDFTKQMGSGWGCKFAPAMAYQSGKYGIGIAYSPKLKLVSESNTIMLKGDGAEQRAFGLCEFEDFVFCTTHLDHRSETAQIQQATTIINWIERHYGDSEKPIFLCGDLNALPDSETLKYLTQNWTIISSLDYTFPASNPIKCIDYILVYKNAVDKVELVDAQVMKTFTSGSVKVASDHLPNMVRVKIE